MSAGGKGMVKVCHDFPLSVVRQCVFPRERMNA